MSRTLTRASFLPALRQAVIDFIPDNDYEADALDYPIINDLARHCCVEAKYERSLAPITDFIETCLIEGDESVRDLVHEFLETLLQCDSIESIRPVLQYNSTRWFDWIQRNSLKRSDAPRPNIETSADRAL